MVSTFIDKETWVVMNHFRVRNEGEKSRSMTLHERITLRGIFRPWGGWMKEARKFIPGIIDGWA